MTKMRGIWQVFQQCYVSRWNGTEELTSCIARSGRERGNRSRSSCSREDSLAVRLKIDRRVNVGRCLELIKSLVKIEMICNI